MAQTGFTPIVTYNTATATTVPSAANLAQGELAVNVTDKKLYTKDSGGNVVLLASNGGDVTGPASSTNLAIPTFSGTGGKTLLNNSGVTISAGVVSGTGFTGALNGSLGATTPSTVVATDLTTTGNTILGNASADTLNVGNGDLVKDANGNIGVAITPNTWWAGKAIQMTGGSIASHPSLAYTYYSSNAYFNASNAATYIANGYATQYAHGGYDGRHLWYNAVSGTAGNAITFTQAMVLDASSNLTVTGTITATGGVNATTLQTHAGSFYLPNLLIDNRGVLDEKCYTTSGWNAWIAFGGGSSFTLVADGPTGLIQSCLEANATGVGGWRSTDVTSATTIKNTSIRVMPTETYTLACKYKLVSGTSIQIYAEYYDVAGAALSATTSSNGTSATWTDLTYSITIPASAAYMSVGVYVTTGVAHFGLWNMIKTV